MLLAPYNIIENIVPTRRINTSDVCSGWKFLAPYIYNINFIQTEFEYLTNQEPFAQDVVAFHILYQAIAIQFNLGSHETRLFIESHGALILERLAMIPPMSRAEIIDEVLDEVKVYGSIG